MIGVDLRARAVPLFKAVSLLALMGQLYVLLDLDVDDGDELAQSWHISRCSPRWR